MEQNMTESPLKNQRIMPSPTHQRNYHDKLRLTNSFQMLSKSPPTHTHSNLNVLSAKIQGIEKRIKDHECRSPAMRYSNTSSKAAAELFMHHKDKTKSIRPAVLGAEQIRSSWDNNLKPIFLKGYQNNEESNEPFRLSFDTNSDVSSKNRLHQLVNQRQTDQKAVGAKPAEIQKALKGEERKNKTTQIYGSQQLKNNSTANELEVKQESGNAAERSDKIKNRIKRSMEVLSYLKSQQNTKAKQLARKKPVLMTEGEIVNGFRLCQKIGKGKFGQVYLALQVKTGMIVAIKRVMKSKLLEYNLVEQFIKQIKIHHALDHPKIVKFYGFFQQKGSVYLVLEYMNGGTLFDYLNIVRTLTIKEAIEYLKDIIEAVTQMHDKAIAHRDIKPQNIVINTEGVAKLCDFGWAAVIDKNRTTYCGTLEYVSPEILDRKSYDQSVDIWSLGILTYEMLMGRAPFQSKDRSAIKAKIRNIDASQIQYSEEVPIEARQFIRWLMQKDPNKRPKVRQLLLHPMFVKFGSSKNSKKLSS